MGTWPAGGVIGGTTGLSKIGAPLLLLVSGFAGVFAPVSGFDPRSVPPSGLAELLEGVWVGKRERLKSCLHAPKRRTKPKRPSGPCGEFFVKPKALPELMGFFMILVS